jgi:hypothetical protein
LKSFSETSFPEESFTVKFGAGDPTTAVSAEARVEEKRVETATPRRKNNCRVFIRYLRE